MLTADRLREVLDYDPETGFFTRRTGRHRGRVNRCGMVHVDGRSYLAHRLAFLWMTGHWPTHQIDHANLDPTDNRWFNLREATHGQNGANRRNTRGHALPKGVSPAKSPGRYRAQIRHDGEKIHLGQFGTPAEAASVYRAAARDLHGEFARAC